MNRNIKKILLSVIAVLIIVVGYIVFPDMGNTPSDTIAETLGILDGGSENNGDADDSEPPETEPITEPSQTETEAPIQTETPVTEIPDTEAPETETPETEAERITEDGEYLSKDDVAEYIHKFGKLPKNFITKEEAEDLGWISREGNLWDVAPGCAIGGDYFGNYEGLLPKAKGRKYYECDVNFDGGYRTGERIVFSNDGLIFYTNDHYETFTELYGD